MPRILAIEWDSREARVAVANVRVGQASIEQAFCVSLESTEGQTAADMQVGQRIGAALAERKVGRAETLVAVGRAGIELKRMTLPPSPDAELPQLVRFQAQREFHSLGEDWPLDFVPLAGSADEPRELLAAAISPELVSQIQQTCQAAGLEPRRLLLRPYAAASLLSRQQAVARARQEPDVERVRLMIDLLGDEADLTVLVDREVVFLRTARLRTEGAWSSEGTRALIAEIRRTLAAVNNQLENLRVQSVCLCGTQEDHTALARQIEEELKLPARPVDPWAGLRLSPELDRNRPDHSERFAPLLGMLLDEAAGAGHALDFLNPRKPAAAPSQRGRLIAMGSAVAALALIAALVIWYRLHSLDNEIARLTVESKKWDEPVKAAGELEQSEQEIESWEATDVVWLDELHGLSQRFPQAKDAMLVDLTAGPHPEGGEILLEGRMREAAVITSLEKGLQDARHHVSGQGRRQDNDQKPYTWRFESSIVVGKEEPLPQPAEDPKSSKEVAAAKKAPSK